MALTLKIGKDSVGLRKIDDNTFEPKSLNVLVDVVNGRSVKTYSNKFLVLNSIPETTYKKVHTIESFCTVSTGDVKEETVIFIKSLRKYHSQLVYVIADVEAKEFINSCRSR